MTFPRIAQFWDLLKSSYWFVPVTMCLAAGAGFYLSGQRDFFLAQWVPDAGILDGNKAESLIAAIVASSITVVSLTFSITIVALTLASSQFGTRLVYSFMRDTSTQVVLGMFSATFIFSMLTLASLVRPDDVMNNPQLRIQICVLLGLSNVFFLIYFLHHIASSIQATAIVRNLSEEVGEQIVRYFPDKQLAVERAESPGNQSRIAIRAVNPGVLQLIDVTRLTEVACQNNLVIDVVCRPGDYLFTGQQLADVLDIDELSESLEHELAGGFLLGERRTLVQDLEYGFTQLVEIAVRALSPGINDPNTAVLCINALVENLIAVMGRQMPSNIVRDNHGDLRLYLNVTDFDGIMSKAFDEIRQHGGSHFVVKFSLLRSLEEMMKHARTEEHRQVISCHFDACLQQVVEPPFNTVDQTHIEQLAQRFTC